MLNGWLIYPIMSLERTGISKDLSKRGAYYAAVNNNFREITRVVQ